jgi:hypothetical protein
VGDIDKVAMTGAVLGTKAGTVVFKHLLSETTTVTEFASGSAQVAASGTATLVLGGVAAARFLMVETSTSFQVTWAGSVTALVNCDGQCFVVIDTTNSVATITCANQNTVDIGTVNWMAAK